jgi:hypothetical protein
MSDFQVYLTIGIFAAVILVIAFDLVDMALAALLGVGAMIVTGILSDKDFLEVPNTAGGAIALLFGGMVVAHVLEKSGVFERLGAPFLRFTGGSGKRFLLLLVLTVAVVCAFLPNATTVILLAPLIIRAAKALDVEFVGHMVITAIVSNAAGLLTLVGDPATFIVGSAIGMTFTQYLKQVSLGACSRCSSSCRSCRGSCRRSGMRAAPCPPRVPRRASPGHGLRRSRFAFSPSWCSCSSSATRCRSRSSRRRWRFSRPLWRCSSSTARGSSRWTMPCARWTGRR